MGTKQGWRKTKRWPVYEDGTKGEPETAWAWDEYDSPLVDLSVELEAGAFRWGVMVHDFGFNEGMEVDHGHSKTLELAKQRAEKAGLVASETLHMARIA